jgi:hypothetical protein
MAVGPANLSAGEFWKTPARGFISASGDFVQSPDFKPCGGPPLRGETDAEYQARLARYDAGIQRVEES